MKKSWTNQHTTNLFKSILKLQTLPEAEKFFRDLLTLREIDSASRRWQAVLLLDKGLSYREVAKRTGHSTTTVGRIARWMRDGEGGYGLMLKSLKS